MTSRERVLRVLNHQEADRRPIQDVVREHTLNRWRTEGFPADVGPGGRVDIGGCALGRVNPHSYDLELEMAVGCRRLIVNIRVGQQAPPCGGLHVVARLHDEPVTVHHLPGHGGPGVIRSCFRGCWPEFLMRPVSNATHPQIPSSRGPLPHMGPSPFVRPRPVNVRMSPDTV